MTSPPRHIGVIELSLLMIVTLGTMVIAVAATIAANDDRSTISDAAPPATTDRSNTTTAPVTTTTTQTTTTRPPTTGAPATAAPTTTVRRTTTTLPPPPPLALLIESDGFNWRFNPCDNPISIRFNPGGYLDEAEQTAVTAFLELQAAELSQLTNMDINYAGLTDQVPEPDEYTPGELILLHIGRTGEGVLDGDFMYGSTRSWSRSRDGFREVDSAEFTFNAEQVDDFQPLSDRGRWALLRMLGTALGLETLSSDDLRAAGVDPFRADIPEVMFQERFGGYPTEWGPGDRTGLSLVGGGNPCF